MVASTSDVHAAHEHQRVRIKALEMKTGAGTCSSNAVTINDVYAGVITTESLTTAAAATQAITLTCDGIEAGDLVFAQCDPASSAGTPEVANVAVSASTAVILLRNAHATAALNAAVKIYFLIVKPRSSMIPV